MVLSNGQSLRSSLLLLVLPLRLALPMAPQGALAVLLRTGLRRALELNHDGTSGSIRELDDALAQLPCALRWTGSAARPEPVRSGVAGALTRIVIAMQDAMAADQWWRLKICLSDECEWAFYDRSKNRSARWCEYGCGDRIRMRAYRARLGSGRSTAAPA